MSKFSPSQIIAAFTIALTVVIAVSFLFSYPLMLLWNGCLVDAIDGVKEVTWLQMWGITVLFSSLFKSFDTNSK
jgi:hypothetical protein